jgi:hypothetical protein
MCVCGVTHARTHRCAQLQRCGYGCTCVSFSHRLRDRLESPLKLSAPSVLNCARWHSIYFIRIVIYVIIFWDMTPCSSAQSVKVMSKNQAASSLHSMFLRNVGELIQLHPRKLYFSVIVEPHTQYDHWSLLYLMEKLKMLSTSYPFLRASYCAVSG